MDKIFPHQFKAARVLACLGQAEVCERAGISLISLRRLESQLHYADQVAAPTIEKVKSVLEAAGVIFFGPLEIAGVSGQYGVALRHPIA
jgi:transcriptional regulator with XRE-family HTH domain